MQKILEIKNKNWMAGISAQPNLAIGGGFQATIGFDPFEQGGLALPSLAPDMKGLSTVAKFLTSFNSSGSNYIYAHTPTKLYQVLRDSPYTVTDETAQINQSLTGNVNQIVGRIIWQNRYIYACITDTSDGYIQSNVFPVASGSDSTLKHGFQSNMDYMAMCVGPDGNLYCGNAGRIYEMTASTGTTGNSGIFYIDPQFNVREILNDGRYLVIFADNNTPNVANRTIGDYKCRVYFWDTVQTTTTNGTGSTIVPDAMWEFSDSYIIGAKIVDGNAIEMITYDGIYVTNVATYPKMIRPFFTSNQTKLGRPVNPEQIKYAKGSLYWVDGSINTNPYVYAYGNPITGQPKIFYIPYSTQGVDGVSQCLLVSGNNVIMATDTPNLFFFNVGSTRGGLQITTLDTNMEQPFTYGFTKVVLGQKLAIGQQVQVLVYGNGGNDLISNETQVYSGGGGSIVGAKQTLMFKLVTTIGNQPTQFEDITLTLAATGAALQRVSTYATPIEDQNVTL